MEIYGGAAEAEERGSGELLPLLEAIKTSETGAYGVGFLGAGWKCRKESEFTMEDERSRRRHPRTPRYVPRSHHHFAPWPRRLQSSYGYGIIRPTVKTTPAVGEVVCIDRRVTCRGDLLVWSQMQGKKYYP